jgi:hypothetical protein
LSAPRSRACSTAAGDISGESEDEDHDLVYDSGNGIHFDNDLGSNLEHNSINNGDTNDGSDDRDLVYDPGGHHLDSINNCAHIKCKAQPAIKVERKASAFSARWHLLWRVDSHLWGTC